MATSRTKRVALNAVVSLLTQIFMILLNFVSRTVFIKTLDIDYLGVNGLFTNVLSILSFAELGIGHAIVFNLYKPLADGDKERLCSLMHLYKKVYRAIFFTVMILGLAMIPFLDVLIKGTTNIKENLIIIYLFFLIDTAISYLYIYKQSIITADQKQYVVTTILTAASCLRVFGQIIILYLTHNFILVLVVNIIFRFAGNVYCSNVANKLYPYILDEPIPLSKTDTKKIFKDVVSMAAYKFGSVILNSTSNIIISTMVSITTVGLVSNYTMLCVACRSLLNGITNSFTASLGNLNATATKEQKYNVFNKVLLITAWIYGMTSIGLIVLSKYFVALWIGENFVLPIFVVIAIVSEFYISGIHTLESHYRFTMGYFVKGKVAPILAALLNIGLAIPFCHLWGVAGVFIATSVARIVTLGIIDSYIIFKDGFQRNPIIYFTKNAVFIFLFIVIGTGCYWLISFSKGHTWISLISQILIVLFVYNIIMLIIYGHTQEFKEIIFAFKGLKKTTEVLD